MAALLKQELKGLMDELLPLLERRNVVEQYLRRELASACQCFLGAADSDLQNVVDGVDRLTRIDTSSRGVLHCIPKPRICVRPKEVAEQDRR